MLPLQKNVPGVPAGFWRRGAAYIIDTIILAAGFFPLHLIFLFLSKSLLGISTMEALADSTTTFVDIIFGTLAHCLYFAYFYSSRGASPGKMVMNLKVLNSRNGKYLGYTQSFLREGLGKMFIEPFTLGIGYFIAGFRKDKLALHDLIFKTQVIRQNAA